jgi:hypothetical protein
MVALSRELPPSAQEMLPETGPRGTIRARAIDLPAH